MHLWAVCFSLGVIALLLLPQLLSLPIILALICLVFIIAIPLKKIPALKYLIAFFLGLAWANLYAQYQLSWNPGDDFETNPVLLQGKIIGLPERKGPVTYFVFALKQANDKKISFAHEVRIRISWYCSEYELHSGEQWQLWVKFKKLRPSHYPGQFNYKQWLFSQGLCITATVISKSPAILIQSDPFWNINNFRENINTAIKNALLSSSLSGLISALAVGIRDDIQSDQWKILRATGTNHLFAIAGLHLGFVCGFIYFISLKLASRISFLTLYYPAPLCAALMALAAAMLYSAMAGFSLPTERALIMTAVFLAAIIYRKNLLPWTAWCIALGLSLLIHPLNVLSESFWLSFSAVALILFGMNYRLNIQGWWWHWGRIQWIMSLGLIPLSLLFFQQVSLIGFFANLIAIPWVGFLVLPLVLLGCVLWLFNHDAACLLWQGAEFILKPLWSILEFLSHHDSLQWYKIIDSPILFLSACVAVLLFLMPRGFPGRWLGLCWSLPLIFTQISAQPDSQFWGSWYQS